MNETDEPEDIVTILKNKLIADKDNPLKEIRRRSDFSQIYLFFDYDSHNNKNQNISDSQILRFRKCLISLMTSLLTMENFLSIILWSSLFDIQKILFLITTISAIQVK